MKPGPRVAGLPFMRFFAFLALLLPLCAQEDFRAEISASAWRTSVKGSLQAAGLPVDLRSDLALEDRTTFFGRLVLKPGQRHRIIVEGSPYSFEGTNTVSRTITFGGRTFTVQDTLRSNADLTYVYGGYQFDLVSSERGHFGLQAGGAYLNASGIITSGTTGVSGSHEEKIGLPLAGAEFRVWPLPFINIAGGVKGMALGGYGHFVQGEISGGIGIKRVNFQAGYRFLDADVHENNDQPDRAGIAPRFGGPFFGVAFRF